MSVSLDALASLVHDAGVIGDGATVIEDLAYDTRATAPGALFFCVPGARFDGHDFAADALGAGAVALVVQRRLAVDAPQVVVPSVRDAMGAIAAPFFGDPSRAMPTIGITGTDGKTTSAYLFASVARARGITPGLITTIETQIGDRREPAERSTPEAIDLQRLLARMRAAGVGAVSMDVSSTGLAHGRVAGTRFACAVFTNLTQDHLEDHGTLEAYFEAKASLFTPELTDHAAINVDDEHGRILVDRGTVPTVTYAMERDADVRATAVRPDATGVDLEADVAGTSVSVRVPLAGTFNAANALGVLAAGVALGWDPDAVAAGIASMPGVPGRLERIEAGQDFTVIVDYAHTAGALEALLRSMRALTADGARLICVYGAAGERDALKRPAMGKAVGSLADVAVITSDDPRGEDPDAIIAELAAGGAGTSAASVAIADRRAAIEHALELARPGDVVVIAGKGHETVQRWADHVVSFDDRVVAREILEARR